MAALGPFAPAPHLAVAVSGGADSLALCLLADAWAKAEGGRITALVVDHRLRCGSTAEAVQVGNWLDRRGIAHQRLVWDGAKPVTGIQAAAREARYRLLADWCRAAGVGHLLVGHQAADQAETVLMRIWRASGIIGLAGIRPCVELADVRLVRPLLGVPPERLRRYLEAEGQPWIEDASNRDPAFTRVRLRQASASLAAFRDLIVQLTEMARREPVSIAIGKLLDQSGYLQDLRDDKSEDSQGRIENLMELVSAAREYERRRKRRRRRCWRNRLSCIRRGSPGWRRRHGGGRRCSSPSVPLPGFSGSSAVAAGSPKIGASHGCSPPCSAKGTATGRRRPSPAAACSRSAGAFGCGVRRGDCRRRVRLSPAAGWSGIGASSSTSRWRTKRRRGSSSKHWARRERGRSPPRLRPRAPTCRRWSGRPCLVSSMPPASSAYLTSVIGGRTARAAFAS